MARGRLISLWRRCSQLTTGVSTAARKREMTNQPTKVRTCQSRNKVPSTTAALKRATTTVRITWLGEMRTHNASARDGGVRLRRSTLRFRLAFCPRVCLRLLLRVLLRTHTQLLLPSLVSTSSMINAATVGVHNHKIHIPKFGPRSRNLINRAATRAMSRTSTEKMAALLVSVGFVNILIPTPLSY